MTTERTKAGTAGRSSIPVIAVSLLGTAWAYAALGQDTREVTVDVERCLDLESAEERQACFGAEVDQVLQERGPAEAAVSAPGGEADRDREARERDSDDVEYLGTIVEMREYLPSAYVIRLDNGQIWEQTEPKRYPLRPGLEVRIYPTRWGSRYRLTGLDTGGHIQVRRVQ